MSQADGLSNSRGAAERFEKWVLPYRRTLERQARHLTGNDADAEDLVQETLVRAFSRRDLLHSSEQIGAWLYTIQRNLFFNDYRRRKRSPILCEYTEEIERTGPVKYQASAEDEVTRRMEHAAVLTALDALPAKYREPLLLADVEQVSYEEVARRLNIPLGTVRSRIARGRQRIQRTLYSWREANALV